MAALNQKLPPASPQKIKTIHIDGIELKQNEEEIKSKPRGSTKALLAALRKAIEEGTFTDDAK